MNPYMYQTTEVVKVPSYRSSEPTLIELFEAQGERESRENTFDPDRLPDDRLPEYLASILKELRLRSHALKCQIYEIGRLLCAAKKALPQGEFQLWIEQNFEHSYRTATNCMNVYTACMGQPEIVEYFSPSCLYIACAPHFPEDLRMALFENASGPVDVSKKQIVELALKYKTGQIDIESEDVQKLLHTEQERDLRERCCIELRALRTLMRERRHRIEDLSSRHPSHPLINDNRHTDAVDWTEVIKEKISNFLGELHLLLNQLKK